MGFFYDLFHGEKKQLFTDTFQDHEKILCEIHSNEKNGAMTIRQITRGLSIKNPIKKYELLVSKGYIRKWTFHGSSIDEYNRSYLITRSGIHKAEELKGYKGTDGLPILGDHLGGGEI